jgi:hypothetical protein
MSDIPRHYASAGVALTLDYSVVKKWRSIVHRLVTVVNSDTNFLGASARRVGLLLSPEINGWAGFRPLVPETDASGYIFLPGNCGPFHLNRFNCGDAITYGWNYNTQSAGGTIVVIETLDDG